MHCGGVSDQYLGSIVIGVSDLGIWLHVYIHTFILRIPDLGMCSPRKLDMCREFQRLETGTTSTMITVKVTCFRWRNPNARPLQQLEGTGLGEILYRDTISWCCHNDDFMFYRRYLFYIGPFLDRKHPSYRDRPSEYHLYEMEYDSFVRRSQRRSSPS